ncbi:MAG: M23 family metallopeptidase [Akkermansia sp.]
MNKIPLRFLFWSFLVLGLILIGFAWFTARHDADPRIGMRTNIHDADVSSHRGNALDPRFLLLSPYDCVKAPTADVFTAPLGNWNGAFTYDALPFNAINSDKNSHHRGQDWNGIGGMNTDLGDPVYAAGRGRVIYVGEPSPDWGKVVVLLHRLPDGKLIESLYAHLDKITVNLGDMIGRGAILGKVGDAHGHYPAHLHFEMIDSFVNEAGMPGYGSKMGNRINPEIIFKKYAPSPDLLVPDVLPALQQIQLNHDLEQIDFKLQ